MDENKKAPLSWSDAGLGIAIFGLGIDDPVLETLIPAGSRPFRVDVGRMTSADIGAQQIGRAICALFPITSQGQNDAIPVIEALASIGFTGEVFVLAPPLLRPKMVESELRSLARGMRLRLMTGVLPPLSEG